MLEMAPDIAFGAFMGRIDVDALVDLSEHETTVPFSNRVSEQVLQWRAKSSNQLERYLMAIASLVTADDPLHEFLLSVVAPIAEEYIYRKGKGTMRDVFGQPMKRRPLDVSIPSIQSLRLPYMTIASVVTDPILCRYVQLLQEQYQRAVAAFKELTLDEFTTRLKDDQGSIAPSLLRVSEPSEPPEPPTLLPSPAVAAPDRKLVRRARKVTWRSIQAMNRIVAPNAYRGFISKDGFRITGHLFDYRVSKTTNLIDHALYPSLHHIPYNLAIFGKDGVYLGNGCIVFDDTPLLDQIIALTLHVRDRETEATLIKTANWWPVSDAYKNEPFRNLANLPEKILIERVLSVFREPKGYWRARRQIIDAIKPNVVTALSQLTRIPRPIFRYMITPTDFTSTTRTYLADPAFRACVDTMRAERYY